MEYKPYEEHLLVCVCVCVCMCVRVCVYVHTAKAMSDVYMAKKRRKEMGLKAKDIFREHITSVTKQTQKILAPFKTELVEARIMNEDAIDLGMLGVSQFQMASNIYSIIMTTIEVVLSKFPDVVAIFYKFSELCSIAEEIEEQGKHGMCLFDFGMEGQGAIRNLH